MILSGFVSWALALLNLAFDEDEQGNRVVIVDSKDKVVRKVSLVRDPDE